MVPLSSYCKKEKVSHFSSITVFEPETIKIFANRFQNLNLFKPITKGNEAWTLVIPCKMLKNFCVDFWYIYCVPFKNKIK